MSGQFYALNIVAMRKITATNMIKSQSKPQPIGLQTQLTWLFSL